MSDADQQLQFLSWSCRGAGAAEGLAVTGLRRTVGLDVVAAAGNRSATVEDAGPITVLGPADVQPRAEDFGIVRRSPRPGDHPIEPNLLACIEFSHPDVPWMFSLHPDRDENDEKLDPWLMLVVLPMPAGSADQRLVTRRDTPYRVLIVDGGNALPNPSDAWAFAHVQVVAPNLDDAKAAIRDLPESVSVRSRIICPTRLKPMTRYFAALVPTYESARRLGAGTPTGRTPLTDIVAVDAGSRMWDPAEPTELPVYDGWYFQTGPTGDFEELARRLRPLTGRQMEDIGLGARQVAIESGAALMTDPANPDDIYRSVHEVPTAIARVLTDHPLAAPPAGDGADPAVADFRARLKELIDLVAGADAADPVVGPPLYGRWPGLADSIDGQPGPGGPVDLQPPPPDSAQTWVEQLNADPHLRIAAGLGTRLVQRDQEEYLTLAWRQLADLTAANRRIRWGQALAAVMEHNHAKLAAAPQAVAMRTLASALTRVRAPGDDHTVHAALDSTTLPVEALGAALTRTARFVVQAARFSGQSVGTTAITTTLSRSLADGVAAALPARFTAPRTVDPAQVETLLAIPGIADRIRRAAGFDPAVQLQKIEAVPQTVTMLAAKVGDEEPADAEIKVHLDAQHQQLLKNLAVQLDEKQVKIAGPAGMAKEAKLFKNIKIKPVHTVSVNAIGALNRAVKLAPDVDVDGVAAKAAPLRVGALGDRLVLGGRFFGTPGSVVAAAAVGARGRTAGAAEALKETVLVDLGVPTVAADTVLGALNDSDAALIKAAVDTVKVDAEAAATPIVPQQLVRFSFDTATAMVDALTPVQNYARMLRYAHGGIGDTAFRRRIGDAAEYPVDYFPAAWAPRMDVALADRLNQLDPEWLLGGVGRLPNNSICLLELNQPFVEAVLVGANHEFAREMLWRGYPTDLRGTCFRRFWNGPPSVSVDALDTWRADIGTHSAKPGAMTVLVIKGDLLRRYPSTLVSAERGSTSAIAGDTSFTPDGPGFVANELFRGFIGDDVSYSVLDRPLDELRERPVGKSTHCWYISLLEPYDELRFGLDEAEPGDVGRNGSTIGAPNRYDVTDDWTWQGFAPDGNPPAYLRPDLIQAGGSSAVAGASLLQRPFRLLLRAPDYLPTG